MTQPLETLQTDPQTSYALIEAKDLAIRFGDPQIVIVEGFCSALRPGQLHVLFGRSGSGKTSILKVLAGLQKPQDGSVRWQGEPLAALSEDQMNQKRLGFIGYVDQGSHLISGFTALENVLLTAIPGRHVKRLTRRAKDLLREIGLETRINHRVELLSGGERQRVALARALLLQPAVLIADEPTASLDRSTADTIIAVLKKYAALGNSVLVASHDPHLLQAADISHEIERSNT